MRKALQGALILLLAVTAAVAQTPPVGFCKNDVAQVISNGLIAPIPLALIYVCSSGTSQANCQSASSSYLVNLYPTTALSGTKLANPYQADAGGNYYFCAAVGHYAINVIGPSGSYFIPDTTFADDWSRGGTVTGTWQATSLVGPLTGNASTATEAQTAGTDCDYSTQFAYGVDVHWNALCHSLPTPATVYYQTVDEAGSPLTQEPVLNCDGTVSCTAGSGQTNVGLPSKGTAGTYTNPASITTDAQGRVTSATSGPVFQEMRITTGICTTPAGSPAWGACSMTTPNWTTAFADTSYAATCTVIDPGTFSGSGDQPVAILYIASKTTTYMTLDLQNGDTNGATANTPAEIDCIGIHP